jgi:hypothetical protein
LGSLEEEANPEGFKTEIPRKVLVGIYFPELRGNVLSRERC